MRNRCVLRILSLEKISKRVLAALVRVAISPVPLIQEPRGHPRHRPADCSEANGDSLHESTVHGSTVRPLHKCWCVVSQRCDSLLIQFENGGLDRIWHLVRAPLFTAKKQS